MRFCEASRYCKKNVKCSAHVQDVHDIMGAGHETTASTAVAALWALAAHPEVEARVHAELDRALGARCLDPGKQEES